MSSKVIQNRSSCDIHFSIQMSIYILHIQALCFFQIVVAAVVVNVRIKILVAAVVVDVVVISPNCKVKLLWPDVVVVVNVTPSKCKLNLSFFCGKRKCTQKNFSILFSLGGSFYYYLLQSQSEKISSSDALKRCCSKFRFNKLYSCTKSV